MYFVVFARSNQTSALYDQLRTKVPVNKPLQAAFNLLPVLVFFWHFTFTHNILYTGCLITVPAVLLGIYIYIFFLKPNGNFPELFMM